MGLFDCGKQKMKSLSNITAVILFMFGSAWVLAELPQRLVILSKRVLSFCQRGMAVAQR
jgi:hypothetical protein